MVFSKLLDSLTSAFDSPTRKNIRQRNANPINELQQGMNLLQQRKQMLNSLSNSSLMESMSASMKTFQAGKDKLKNVSKNELDALRVWKKILIKVYHHILKNIKILWKITIKP